MPAYTYECSKGHQFVELRSIRLRASKATCGICKGAAKQIVAFAPAVHRFKLGYMEHIEREPVYVKSKKHLRELCNRNECYAPGILD